MYLGLTVLINPKNIFSYDPHHNKCNSYDFVCAAKREFGKRVGALMKPTPAQLFI